MIGFANKGNAMKTLKNNFTKEEDYKTSFIPKEKSRWGGSGGEDIRINNKITKSSKYYIKRTKIYLKTTDITMYSYKWIK